MNMEQLRGSIADNILILDELDSKYTLQGKQLEAKEVREAAALGITLLSTIAREEKVNPEILKSAVQFARLTLQCQFNYMLSLRISLFKSSKLGVLTK